MAPVGQTWPQRVQPNSQYPIRGTSTGVQSPSRPASSSVGWSPPVMHTFMHSPHRTQLWRNVVSASAPGGRMSFASDIRGRASGEMRNSGTAKAPAKIEAITFLRPRSRPPRGRPFIRPKLTAFFGHASSQLLHRRHSEARHLSLPAGTASA